MLAGSFYCPVNMQMRWGDIPWVFFADRIDLNKFGLIILLSNESKLLLQLAAITIQDVP